MKNPYHAFLLAALVSLHGAPFARAGVADAPEAVVPLVAGVAAPSGILTSPDGANVALSTVIRDRPTILIFYRGGWCPYCNRHLVEVGESYLELRQLGYQVVGITPDDLGAVKETVNKHHLLYQLFSDRQMAVTPAFGVAYRIKADTAEAYKENGINLAPIPGESAFWLPVDSAFVIGRDGIIKFVYFNPDPSVKISKQQLMAAAKAAL